MSLTEGPVVVVFFSVLKVTRIYGKIYNKHVLEEKRIPLLLSLSVLLIRRSPVNFNRFNYGLRILYPKEYETVH